MRLGAAILLLLADLTRVHPGIFNAGPYNLKLDRFELCEDQGTNEAPSNWWTVKRSTRKTFIHGQVHVPFDYDDTVSSQVNFSRFGSRGWGRNAYNLKDNNFCQSFINNYPTLFDYFYKSWGIEKPSCPLKAGNYTMELDTDLPQLANLPFLPYGRYKIEQAILRGIPPVRFGCSIWYVTCSERPR